MIIKNDQKQVWLEKFNSFSLEGEHSRRFLNGLTTSKINLNDDVIQTCWLTPTGNLKSILEIHFEEGKMQVIILQGDHCEIRNFYENMIFPGDNIFLSNSYEISRVQNVDNIFSWRYHKSKLLKQNEIKEFCIENHIQPMDFETLQEWKLRQAFPLLNCEIDGVNNPLELGLYDLVDFDKGCYLGQETMARLNKLPSLKQEIRVWESNIETSHKKLNDKKIFLNTNKKEIVGYITRFLLRKNKALGLAMIKRNYLDNFKTFFSADFGNINVNKSVSSVFLS